MSIGLGIGVQRPKQLRSIYSVDGKVPGFTADFIKNKYPSYPSFASAITHSRSGNATMTDGYGPELVTNGGFDSDSGWTLPSNMSISDGVLSVSNATNQSAQQQITGVVSGKTYVIQFTISNYVSGSVRAQIGGATSFFSSNGTHTGIVTATSTPQTLLLTVGGTAASFTIDNVSVRAMPVLKWAPHNLLTYSEEFDNAGWGKTDTTISANQAVAPDGTTTADQLEHTGQSGLGLDQQITSVTAVPHTVRVFVKNVDHQWFRLYADAGSVWFDLQANTVGTVNSGLSDASITAVGNDWYLCSVTATPSPTTLSVSMFLSTTDGGFQESTTTSVYIWGAHAFRSDLGGMVDNPDQPPSRASYVPTTSSAKYLPRIGHHVYNGSAWVNEGLLAESEARTNLIEYSTPNSTNWTLSSVTLTADDAVSPDGTENAARINETTTSSGHNIRANNTNVTSGLDYTLSAYVKADTSTACQLLFSNTGFGSSQYANFDLSTGTVGYEAANATATIQDVGNGWYRCAVTSTATATVSSTIGFVIFVDNDPTTSTRGPVYAGDTAQQMYVYGVQVEQASTPSSLIPTSGSSVTRAAESFTIPSANLPWPSPVYVGDEEVINGTFNTNISGWNTRDTGVATFDSGALKLERTAAGSVSGIALAYQSITGLTVGKIYRASADIFFDSADAPINGNFSAELALDQSEKLESTSSRSSTLGFNTVENISFIFIATSTTHELGLSARGAAEGFVNYDNISVREINPLSVSIAMDGRVSFADENTSQQHYLVNWFDDTSNMIRTWIDTTQGTGAFDFRQSEGGTTDIVTSGTDTLAPDILVPYSIAQRHGSTFLNGALDGVSLTEDTTPTALPDLSATDLNIAYDYMGTIGTFRVWDKDITDDGLVEATNPSLEPSLSLDFLGTGTTSFTVSDWSE